MTHGTTHVDMALLVRKIRHNTTWHKANGGHGTTRVRACIGLPLIADWTRWSSLIQGGIELLPKSQN